MSEYVCIIEHDVCSESDLSTVKSVDITTIDMREVSASWQRNRRSSCVSVKY